MSKKTKRLREEIKQLHQDIGELISNPNSIESLGIKFRYQFKQDFIRVVMFGAPDITCRPCSGRIISSLMKK